jgi:hypothetical protein
VAARKFSLEQNIATFALNIDDFQARKKIKTK